MQQPRFRRQASPNHMLQISRLVVLNMCSRVFVTSPCHEHSSVDDQSAQVLERLAEAGE